MKVLSGILAALIGINSMAFGVLASPPAPVPAKADQSKARWRDNSFKISISSSLTANATNIKFDSDVVGAVLRSLKAWEAVADIKFQVDFTDRQSVSQAGTSGDGVNLITIAQTPENVLFFSKNGGSDSARTRVFVNRRGFISEADIVLSPFQQFSTDGSFGTFDLESTLTHEIGHLLGLRHSGVLGSMMADNIPKNGAFGTPFSSRALSDSDAASARDIFGAPGEIECCASISGKLSLPNGKPAKGFQVWAEEDGTGRVLGHAETAIDGSYRIGGLLDANALLFWRKTDDPMASQIGEIGLFKLLKNAPALVNEKVLVSRSEFALNYIGTNRSLTDSSVSIKAGGEYVIYLGGQEIGPANFSIEFNSPFLKVARGSVAAEEFSDGIPAVSFVLTVDQATPPGTYSLFAINRSGTRTALVGAINIY